MGMAHILANNMAKYLVLKGSALASVTSVILLTKQYVSFLLIAYFHQPKWVIVEAQIGNYKRHAFKGLFPDPLTFNDLCFQSHCKKVEISFVPLLGEEQR